MNTLFVKIEKTIDLMLRGADNVGVLELCK